MDENLTREQMKLVTHPLREDMVRLLAEQPMTAKQVAVKLGATVGNAHYHLQRLVGGGLAFAEDIVNAEGTVEKRYHIAVPERAEPAAPLKLEANLLAMDETLWLTVAETGQLVNELKAFLYRWQTLHKEPRGRAQAVALSVKCGRPSTN